MTDPSILTELPSSAPRNTRQDILAAAHRLFTDNGYHGASMRRIAEEAGVALGAAYNHFSSKEEIFVQVLMAYHPYHEMSAALSSAEGEDIAARLHDAARKMEAGLLNTPKRFLALMFIELVEFDAKHLHTLVGNIFPQLFAANQVVFTDRNQLRDIPAAMQMRTLLGTLFAYFMTEWLISPNLPAEARTNALHYMIEIYLHGILKSNPEEAE